jgi:chemotaxis protein MotB
MRITTVATIVVISAVFMISGGCVSSGKYRELQAQNRIQQDRLAQLEAEANTARLQLDQLKQRLAEAESRGGTEVDALKQQVAALEQAIEQKNQLIAQLQGKLLRGGQALPPELNSMLEEWAAANPDLVSYDPNSGIVKFKSDLLFAPGSDKIDPAAMEAIKKLVQILNSEEAKQFDAIVAGHTDDLPIKKAETRAAHPSNWYLSAHRAISVLNAIVDNGLVPTRISERGFGEFRPLAPNAPNHKGNPANRRVEIYIVQAGM